MANSEKMHTWRGPPTRSGVRLDGAEHSLLQGQGGQQQLRGMEGKANQGYFISVFRIRIQDFDD
jgi:hypothetical protein